MPHFQLPWSRFPGPEDEGLVPARPFRWRLWLGLGVGLLVVAVGLGLWLAPRLERNLSARSVREAQEMLRDQDYRRAQLLLEQAVQSNPGDFQTRRELAKFYEDAGSPRGLIIWRQLIEAEPSNDADRVAYASFALLMNDLAAARSALAGVGAAGRTTVEYHRAVAGLALRDGDQKKLEGELAELAVLEPDNQRAQFNHAAIELAMGAGAPARGDEAIRVLAKLARGDQLRIRATLELIRADSRARAPNYAALAEQILPARHGAESFLAWAAPPRGLIDLIAYMENQPKPQPEDAALLADWMRRQGLVSEAAFWLSQLDPRVQRTVSVLAVRAACSVQLRDWRGLENTLRAGAWGRASDEALDLAFAANLQRESRHEEHGKDTWNDALDSAGGSLESLHVLLRLAGEVGWTEATSLTLERLVKVNPHEIQAWNALVAIDIAQGATQRLVQRYDAWHRAEPANPETKGGLAWLEVLLAKRNPPVSLDPDPAEKGDAAWAAAQALRLHQRGRDGEALASLEGLNRAQQGDRRVLLIRGLILSGMGRRSESDKSLTAAAASPLLPEESALLKMARAHNGSG